jgi:hypothetical protein
VTGFLSGRRHFPRNGGKIALPGIAMTGSDDAWLLSGPSPSMTSEKVFEQPVAEKRPDAALRHHA